jgi:hypothetical protein
MSPTASTVSRGRYATQRALLLALTVYTVVAAVALLAVDTLPVGARIVLALPILVFTPGYALVSALFIVGTQVRTVERAIVGVVVSLALTPMVALVVNFTVGLDATVVLEGLVGVTLVGATLAFVRTSGRRAEPLAPQTDGGELRRSWTPARPDTLSLVAIALVAILLTASAAIAFTGSPTGQSNTEFYVENTPAVVGAAEAGAQPVTEYDLRVTHHGDTAQRFTVVALSVAAGDGTQSQDPTEFARRSTTVAPDQSAPLTVQVPQSVEPGSTVLFLLYEGDAPQTPSQRTAYRTLKVTVPGSSE